MLDERPEIAAQHSHPPSDPHRGQPNHFDPVTHRLRVELKDRRATSPTSVTVKNSSIIRGPGPGQRSALFALPSSGRHRRISSIAALEPVAADGVMAITHARTSRGPPRRCLHRPARRARRQASPRDGIVAHAHENDANHFQATAVLVRAVPTPFGPRRVGVDRAGNPGWRGPFCLDRCPGVGLRRASASRGRGRPKGWDQE